MNETQINSVFVLWSNEKWVLSNEKLLDCPNSDDNCFSMVNTQNVFARYEAIKRLNFALKIGYEFMC